MKKILILIALSLVLLPTLALAADSTGIVPCGTSDQVGERCTFDKLKSMPIIVINWIKNNLILPLAIILIVIGGLIILSSGGDPGRFKLGKDIIIATLVGGLLAYGAVAIVNMIISALGGTPVTG